MHRTLLALPVISLGATVALWGRHPEGWALVLLLPLLAGSVVAAVHHAEVVAHRIGEPFGSLLLAVAVTVIEVGLIVMLMVAGKGEVLIGPSDEPTDRIVQPSGGLFRPLEEKWWARLTLLLFSRLRL